MLQKRSNFNVRNSYSRIYTSSHILLQNSTPIRYLVVRSLEDDTVVAIPNTWVMRSGLCAYSSTANHLEPMFTGAGWSVFQFRQLQEFDTYENCKKGIELMKSNDQGTRNVDMDDDTLPMPSKRPKRDAKKNDKNFLYNSMDIEVAASEVGCIKPQYPDYNIFDDFVAPIPRY
uniref:Uncharacterized protein n=1 Tax=Trichobilharzia regenti TaxID=157069 RepID=A0AA85K1M5_TRIRE|nr:unnamed protein product [Trichobilharzia regenti]